MSAPHIILDSLPSLCQISSHLVEVSESIPGNPDSRAPGIPGNFSFPIPRNFYANIPGKRERLYLAYVEQIVMS